MIVGRKFLIRRLVGVLIAALIILGGTASPGWAEEKVKLVIDGHEVTTAPAPIITDGRTLVPVRLVSETLGAVVDWYEESKTVSIAKGDHFVKLLIDNRLVNYSNENINFGLSDVPPQIIGDRTFVPLRLVSNALGVSVHWDAASKTVSVDSNVPASIKPFYDISFRDLNPGDVIGVNTDLQLTFGDISPTNGSEVRYLLLNPETGRGTVVARGNDLNGTYSWLPDPAYGGPRVLAVGIYTQEGQFLAGSVVPVEVAVKPKVSLAGLTQGQEITETAEFSVDLNFVSEYVKYEITNKNTGTVVITDESDPQGSYSWTPQFGNNDEYSVRALASDRLGQIYYSSAINVRANVGRRLALRGVASAATIEKPVTLWLSRNFPVSKTEYVLKNNSTEKEKILFETTGYSSYKWFPKPELAGSWELFARVQDEEGNVHITNVLSVKLGDKPQLLLQSVGPNEVLTGTVKLTSTSNVSLSNIEYRLIKTGAGTEKVIAGDSANQAGYSWTPEKKDEGSWQLQATAVTTSGERIASELIPIKVYLGKTFGSQPIIEKSKFLDYVSQLAERSQEKTGMSAALQVAQATLETGWGQYTPADKYTGQLSNNLFGIKGKGPAGSVISNTWEEYNGNTFRIDAPFRAYNDPQGSWTDHKQLLLTSSRYEPFREVMHNSTQGAWALRRTGYATDSKYPGKLIDIINRYDLQLLDEVNI